MAPLRAPVETVGIAILAAAFYPPDEHFEVVAVNANGVFEVAWKKINGPWHAPVPQLADHLPAGAPLALVASEARPQLEAFVVDLSGRVNVIWKVGNEPWHTPSTRTSVGFAPRGAGICAAHYMPYDQLEVFVVDVHGVLNLIWKEGNGDWKQPVGLTPQQFAPKGAHLACAGNPADASLQVFAIASNGTVSEIRKHHNGKWCKPFGVTDPELAPPGAPLAAMHYPAFNQT